MKKPNYRPIIRSYLISVLETEEHGIENPSDNQLFAYTKDRFFAEHGWQVDRLGLQMAIREWLLGLALSVEYTYYHIEILLKSWGVLKGTETVRQLDKELDRYWDRLAMVLASEFKKAN